MSQDQEIPEIPALVRGTARLKAAHAIWAAVACALLGASGVVRAVQDHRHGIEKNYLETCPISLKAIPQKLGDWRMIDGGEGTLDSLTMRISGGTDHILRTYADDLTGVSVMVLVLFGPAEPVLPHTPEICYPSNGYAPVEDSMIRVIKGKDGRDYLFRAGVYGKSGGRTMLREESYYSFRLGGSWSPDAGAGQKFPRRNPSVFKIQIQRRVVEGERRDNDDPTEQFLALLVAEIEQLIAEAATPDGSKASGPKAVRVAQ